jgi:hypothetical protein
MAKSRGEVIPMLNKAPCYEDVWRSGGIALFFFLTFDTGWNDRLAFLHESLGNEPPLSHLVGVWVGPRALLDAVVKSLSPQWEWNVTCPS